jgi:hypothetical protein
VPPYPLNIIPYIDLAWLLLGVAVLTWLWRNRRDSVLATQMIVLEADPAADPVPAAAPGGAPAGPDAHAEPPPDPDPSAAGA